MGEIPSFVVVPVALLVGFAILNLATSTPTAAATKLPSSADPQGWEDIWMGVGFLIALLVGATLLRVGWKVAVWAWQ